MKTEILDYFNGELSRSSRHCQGSRCFYARKFLEYAGDRPFSEWNKALVNDYLDSLRKDGYADGSIRFIYGIVKRVFDAAKSVHEAEKNKLISGIDPDDPGAVASVLQAMVLPGPNWDLGKRSAPRVEREVKPSLTVEEIGAMVQAAKELGGPEAVYLALSTVYGLRRGELCAVRREHFDFTQGTLFVMTEKGGERRNQLLCDDLVPLLAGYDFTRQYSDWSMSAMYRRMAARAGVEVPDSGGWHSCRRFLDTKLVKIFGEMDAHIFLRWRLSTSSLMVERYFTEPPLEVDRRVLKGHPIVPLWQQAM